MIFRCLMTLLMLLAGVLAPAEDVPLHAQPPKPPPWADPQAMFEQIFGKQDEVDEKVLAEIEVSAKEEQQIGERAVEAYLAQLKRQRMRVVTRGRDVEYLRRLVEKLQPMMQNRQRYPTIHVYLIFLLSFPLCPRLRARPPAPSCPCTYTCERTHP